MKANSFFKAPIRTIDNFWTAAQCAAFIQRSEAIGFSDATVSTELGERRVAHIRNNERILLRDEKLALELWENLKEFVPHRYGNSVAVGLNELFRCYKYQNGQVFKRHRDQSYVRENGDASYITFMIYLNDNFKGGSTRFEEREILPKQGTCLLFLHDLEHEGSEVHQGVKYVLRSDVMYRFNSSE